MQHRAHFGVQLDGIVRFEHAELKFVGRRCGITGVNCAAVY
jgi:hypothetical protein